FFGHGSIGHGRSLNLCHPSERARISAIRNDGLRSGSRLCAGGGRPCPLASLRAESAPVLCEPDPAAAETPELRFLPPPRNFDRLDGLRRSPRNRGPGPSFFAHI